jgi:hypothetical protein
MNRKCLQEVDAAADCDPTKAPEVMEDFQYDEAIKIQIKELNLVSPAKLIWAHIDRRSINKIFNQSIKISPSEPYS